MEYKWNDRDNNNVSSDLGNTGNHVNEQNRMEENHMEQNNQLGRNSNSENLTGGAYGSSVGTNAEGAGTETSGSIYSYSYRDQANQERNPNYYEKKEQEGSSQRTYTAGTYGFSGTGDQASAGSAATQNSVENTSYAGSQSDAGNAAYTSSQASAAYEASQGSAEGTSSAGSQESTAYAGSQRNNGQAASAWSQGSTGNTAYAEGQASKKKKKKISGRKKQHGFGMVVAKCAGLALVFGLVSSTVFYGTGLAFQHTAGGDQANLEASASSGKNKVTVNSGNLSATNVSTATTVTDVSDIVENVMPSIVSITNMAQTVTPDFFGRYYQQETPSAGSGIIIGQTDEEIYVATNNHVVANSNQLTVNFVDDQQVTAEIKGTDPSTDLAVVSVKTKDIPSDTLEQIKVATMGNSDDVKVGQSVVAIGNALGYGQSVTTGVVSALDREVTLQDETTGETITNDLLQTDAAINPGNSGGALLNMNGELVGINSAKYSDTQVEGMGYAIPISAAEPIINDLITREVVDESNSAFLGVSGQDVTSELSESFGMPEGLYITMVTEKSAAEQAGIKKGDVLTEFDGRAVKSMENLMDIMQYYAAGTEVEITLQINENGEWKEQKVTATLGRKNN